MMWSVMPMMSAIAHSPVTTWSLRHNCGKIYPQLLGYISPSIVNLLHIYNSMNILARNISQLSSYANIPAGISLLQQLQGRSSINLAVGSYTFRHHGTALIQKLLLSNTKFLCYLLPAITIGFGINHIRKGLATKLGNISCITSLMEITSIIAIAENFIFAYTAIVSQFLCHSINIIPWRLLLSNYWSWSIATRSCIGSIQQHGRTCYNNGTRSQTYKDLFIKIFHIQHLLYYVLYPCGYFVHYT